MKKQSGFTLIELMVVMAIIAILATAGLSAYTGYLKKARDAKRIADVNAMNTIVLGSLSTSGQPPTQAQFIELVTAMNNGVMMEDPLSWLEQCLSWNGTDWETGAQCNYYYYSEADAPGSERCTNGYMIRASFESTSNESLMKFIDDVNDGWWTYWVGDCTYFEII